MPVRVYREAYTRTPPTHAERRGKKIRWKGRGGKWIEADPLPDGKARVPVLDVWYFEYTGPDGTPVRRKGFTDKAATDAEARRLQALADRQRAGLAPRSDAAHADKSLRLHLADYLDFLRAKGRTPHHVDDVANRVGTVIGATGAAAASDLTEHAVTVAVGRLRQPGRGRKGIGPATARGYVSSVKSFLRWMVRDRRAAANPLADVALERDQTDVRRRRRRLTDPEFDRLLAAAARSRPKKARVNGRPCGEARVCVYLTAAFTGFRAQEVASLAPEAFRLDGPAPFVVLAAAASKRGTEDVIPIPAGVADRLRAFLAGKPPRRPVWPGRWWAKAAGLVAADLAACDPPIPYRDERGRYADFHSLRRTFGGKLAAAGVDVKTAQKMMRHSSAVLTLDVYRDEAELGDMAAAAAMLAVPAALRVTLPEILPVTAKDCTGDQRIPRPPGRGREPKPA